ncbi:MAG: Hsp70 family protein [Alphaproteobacteria bacterium]|nr:Hsp70 family protein [Alphaproteobacteria bacterium]
MRIGIDFGTTNSAVAVLGPGGPRLLELAPGERTQRTVIHASTEGEITFGNAAFRAYVEQDLSGRFLRSIKAFLSQDVPKTTLGRRRYAFTELISAYLRFLITGAERVTGESVTHVVVGRPVSFSNDVERDELALTRLQQAIADAGVGSVGLQLEPVAAAYRYELGLDRERIVLVGDFGGGTSDFAILRCGPERTASRDRLDDVLGTSGVAQAGDVLDGRFMDTFLMDAFGRGSTWVRPYRTEPEPWDHPVQRQIQRLYYLHLLRSRELQEGLDRLEPRMTDPTVVRRLRRLIFDDLGYPMAWAIEAAKRAFADGPAVTFRFDEFYSEALDLRRDVDLGTYEEGCAAVLDAYRGAIDEVLVRAGLTADDVDDVFLTGGTSQLPFVRGLFAERFGPGRLRSADAFTSVCEGLAVAAA